jgi:hypothetical protein
MFSIDGVNVEDDSDALHRGGWDAARFPAFRNGDEIVWVDGWIRGPFGIFTREFYEADVGNMGAVPLTRVNVDSYACAGGLRVEL